MKQEDLYKQLVDRYLDGTASVAEVEVFFHLLNEGKLDGLLGETGVAEGAPLRGGVPSERDELKRRRIPLWKRYSVAAAVILLAGIGGFLLLRPRHAEGTAPVANVFKNDIAPGGNKAILTLGDGRSIVLDSAGTGNLASEGGSEIVKKAAGQLVYDAEGNGAGAPDARGTLRSGGSANGTSRSGGGAGRAGEVAINTLSTPAGGQYQVTLADGTRVWLNALSKLQFPSAFRGTDRTVEISGEGYFEVAPDKSRPFFVKMNGMLVQVLGTSFNVNAYTDEPEIRTTLLTGAVRLVKGDAAVALKPGEMGVAIAGNVVSPAASGNARGGVGSGHPANDLTVRTADLDQVMAWKNGTFSWDHADVHTVMRQLSRWYGVDVTYEGTPTKALFGGEIGRDLSLKQVLTGLSGSRVHFRLEGKSLTVLP